MENQLEKTDQSISLEVDEQSKTSDSEDDIPLFATVQRFSPEVDEQSKTTESEDNIPLFVKVEMDLPKVLILRNKSRAQAKKTNVKEDVQSKTADSEELSILSLFPNTKHLVDKPRVIILDKKIEARAKAQKARAKAQKVKGKENKSNVAEVDGLSEMSDSEDIIPMFPREKVEPKKCKAKAKETKVKENKSNVEVDGLSELSDSEDIIPMFPQDESIGLEADGQSKTSDS